MIIATTTACYIQHKELIPACRISILRFRLGYNMQPVLFQFARSYLNQDTSPQPLQTKRFHLPFYLFK